MPGTFGSAWHVQETRFHPKENQAVMARGLVRAGGEDSGEGAAYGSDGSSAHEGGESDTEKG